METRLQLVRSRQPAAPVRIQPVLWQDPQTVAPEELAGYIDLLERACRENPRSADLRTCLGMAYAMNFEAYRSMDALELARGLDPEHFFAQFKYAELLYRLRSLPRAEEETKRAIKLALNPWESALARQQLKEIRHLMREGAQRPAWIKPISGPAVGVFLLLCILSRAVVLR